MGGALKARSSSIVLGIVLIGSLFAAAAAAVDNDVAGDRFHQEFISWLSLNNKTISELRHELEQQEFAKYATDDSNSLTFGVETIGGVMTEIIPTWSYWTNRRSKVFTTTRDQQSTVTIQVFQGKRRLTKNCLFLGEFNLTGIPPAPRGTPQIEVTFEIDYSGTLIVKAEEKASGLSEKMAIPNDDYHLCYDDEKEMIREAKEEKKAEEEKLVGPHVLKTYVENHIRNHLNDRDHNQAVKLTLKKVEPSIYDEYDALLALLDARYSRWRFKIKTSKSDNQIAER